MSKEKSEKNRINKEAYRVGLLKSIELFNHEFKTYCNIKHKSYVDNSIAFENRWGVLIEFETESPFKQIINYERPVRLINHLFDIPDIKNHSLADKHIFIKVKLSDSTEVIRDEVAKLVGEMKALRKNYIIREDIDVTDDPRFHFSASEEISAKMFSPFFKKVNQEIEVRNRELTIENVLPLFNDYYLDNENIFNDKINNFLSEINEDLILNSKPKLGYHIGQFSSQVLSKIKEIQLIIDQDQAIFDFEHRCYRPFNGYEN